MYTDLPGGHCRQGLFELQKLDDHIEKMLKDGWEVLSQTSHSGERIVLRSFSKRDTITITFRRI